MKRMLLIPRIIALFTVTLLSSVPLLGVDGASATDSVIVPPDARSAAFAGETSVDIGVVDLAATDEASHGFVLKNITKAPISVTSIRGSCGCEHLALFAGGREQQHLVVQPGQSFEARVGVRLPGQPSGSISKSAWVMGGPDAQRQLAALTLSFTLRQPYALEPARLDFGNVAAGGSASAVVIVKIDDVVSKKGQAPHLSSDAPAVTVMQIDKPQAIVRNGRPCHATRFRVVVADTTSIGALRAMLHLTSEQAKPSDLSVNTYLPVSGTVVGDIAATPKAIYFGAVVQGSKAIRAFVITGRSAADLQSLSIQSESPWIQVPVSAGNVAPSTSRIVTISLLATAPVGILETALTLRSGSGQQLRLPIKAEIVGPP